MFEENDEEIMDASDGSSPGNTFASFVRAKTPVSRVRHLHWLQTLVMLLLLADMTSAHASSDDIPATLSPDSETSVYYFIDLVVTANEPKNESQISDWLSDVFTSKLQSCVSLRATTTSPQTTYETTLMTTVTTTMQSFNTTTPAATTTLPSANTTTPAATTTLPSTITTTPAATTTLPSAITTTPAATTTLPSAITTTPAATTTLPSATTTTPATTATLPSATTTTPAATMLQSATTTTPAATTTLQSAITTTPAATTTLLSAITTTPAATTTLQSAITTTPAATTTLLSAITTTPAATTLPSATTTTPAATTTLQSAITTTPAATTLPSAITTTPAATTLPSAITTTPAATTLPSAITTTPATTATATTPARIQPSKEIKATTAVTTPATTAATTALSNSATTVLPTITTPTPATTTPTTRIVRTRPQQGNNGNNNNNGRLRRDIRNHGTQVRTNQIFGLFKGINVTCIKKTAIRETRCLVTLQLHQRISSCCILRRLCAASRESSDIRTVGKPADANITLENECDSAIQELNGCTFTGGPEASCPSGTPVVVQLGEQCVVDPRPDNATSAENQANALLALTADVSQLNSSQVAQLVSQLEGLLSGPSVSMGLGNTSVHIVSNLLGASAEVLSDSSDSIIGIVDTVGLKLVLGGEAETLLSPSVALSVKPADGTNFQETIFSISDPSNVQVRGDPRRGRSLRADSTAPQGSIRLPPSLTQDLTGEQQQLATRVQFNFYQESTVYQVLTVIINNNIFIYVLFYYGFGCWLKNDIAFYVAVVAYFCVIFVFNIAMFIVVLVQLCRLKRQNPHNMQHRTTLQDVRSVAGIMILLGLTWGFAFFAWGPLNLPFMYLFAIFNSLQGFFIFLFYCAVKENVRKQWRTYLCCGRMRLAENSEWSRICNRGPGEVAGVQSDIQQLVLVFPRQRLNGAVNPIDDRAITADENQSADVVLNEINSQYRNQRAA
ncbi:mucin-19-like [Pseudoliparis swirei]|uniref:mucin-19-like n=1 Tax=Pseudoliparis swirei TaxID=2059687 RepID=UPI0024BE8732|nr:mucin-19-like [Pseudoliparis swirei]